MPRIARVVVANYPHHITQRGINKAEIFIDDEDRGYFLQYLKDWSKRTDTKVWAYCLMGNHFHLLLGPAREDSLERCLHGTTFRYAQHFNLKYGRSGRLWQSRYFSCAVDKEEYLWVVARYIEKNPVRAKIVKKAEDWKWSSARAHIKGMRDDILDKIWGLSPHLSRGDYLCHQATKPPRILRSNPLCIRILVAEGFHRVLILSALAPK